MQTTSTFTVETFEPTDVAPPETTTATPVGVARMVKRFRGGLEGRSETLFTSAFDQAKGVGTYVAMESFAGSLDGRSGTVNIAHTATTDGGPDRLHEVVVIVPASGTGELAGLTGTGRMHIAADGTHHLDLDYEIG
jgi:hypothetical protein